VKDSTKTAIRAVIGALEALIEHDDHEPEQPVVMTMRAAAARSGLPLGTIRSWCRSGRLRSFRGPRSAYMIDSRDLDYAIRAEPSPPRGRSEPPANDSEADDAVDDELEAAIRGGEFLATRATR